jgi:putative hemolysin
MILYPAWEKKMNTQKLIFSFIAMLIVLTAGCSPEEPATSESELPNPASVFCEEQGGIVEIRSNPDGSQYGVCLFPDGSECEEWAFFRGECQPGATEPPVPVPTATSLPVPAETAQPLPLVSGYTNDAFGFAFGLPEGWEVEEHEDYVLFNTPGYRIFVRYQWANEDPRPFRTGMPEGEFVEGGAAVLLGQPLPKQILVLEGKNKVIAYGGRIKVGDLILVVYLDAVETGDMSYQDLDIPPEILAQADQILASFALNSGDTPVLEFNP